MADDMEKKGQQGQQGQQSGQTGQHGQTGQKGQQTGQEQPKKGGQSDVDEEEGEGNRQRRAS
jgi:hypothetical protein